PIWASVTILSLCLYGTFTSRYAMEPLLGLALAVAPSLAQRGMSLIRWCLGPLVVGHLVLCLAPDLVYRWPPLRTVVTVADQRFGSLAALTRWREGEWESFAGRATGPWEPIPNRAMVSGDGMPEGRVARSGDYLRMGYGISLHCPPAGDTVIRRDGMWEWNVWYWRVVPFGKTSGIHVLDPAPWSVHPGTREYDHRRCRRVISSPPVERAMSAPESINEWLADIPELMNRGRVRAWLGEVWASEEGCPVPLRPSSFREQELGRLLVRDDGWLDDGELAYVRRHARRSLGK
ncbi:MAG: hypothetical protein MUE60_12750, partial [Candidatus Eisenbacteria bacterium]|nr:hypothetical protein [Candidatus Eisenbacteria bacterium]